MLLALIIFVLIGLVFLSVCCSTIQAHNLSSFENKLAIRVTQYLPVKDDVEARFNTANEIVLDLGKAITGPNEIEKPANIKAIFPRVKQYYQKAEIQPLRAKVPERPMLRVVNSNCKKTRS